MVRPQINIQYGVVAHTSRSGQAWELFESVGGRIISVDDGTLGCNGNHVRVLKDLLPYRADWNVILEDDAEPVEGFTEQVQAALAVAPARIVSFYLGTSNPIHWQPTIERTLAMSRGESWITSDFLLHAVGYAVHSSVMDALLYQLDPRARVPIDEQISYFCRFGGVKVGYTLPSLVDHKDGPTVISRHPDGAPRLLPRKAWRLGPRDEWSSRTIELS